MTQGARELGFSFSCLRQDVRLVTETLSRGASAGGFDFDLAEERKEPGRITVIGRCFRQEELIMANVLAKLNRPTLLSEKIQFEDLSRRVIDDKTITRHVWYRSVRSVLDPGGPTED